MCLGMLVWVCVYLGVPMFLGVDVSGSWMYLGVGGIWVLEVSGCGCIWVWMYLGVGCIWVNVSGCAHVGSYIKGLQTGLGPDRNGLAEAACVSLHGVRQLGPTCRKNTTTNWNISH